MVVDAKQVCGDGKMDKVICIYGLRDPDTNEIRYIGKSSRPRVRLNIHIRMAIPKTHKGSWIRGLIIRGRLPELFVIEKVQDNFANARERHWIRFYRNLGCNLTNATDGGDGGATNTGKHFSLEHKRRISEANKGQIPWTKGKTRKQFPDQIKGMLGKYHSESARLKISLVQKGKPRPLHSEATKSKMRQSHLRRWAKRRESKDACSWE